MLAMTTRHALSERDRRTATPRWNLTAKQSKQSQRRRPPASHPVKGSIDATAFATADGRPLMNPLRAAKHSPQQLAVQSHHGFGAPDGNVRIRESRNPVVSMMQIVADVARLFWHDIP